MSEPASHPLPGPGPLVCAVSPYHLTTQEPPALASLQLAERVVTLMPAPLAGRGREDVREAVERSPRYLRFMESWRWTMPLWHAGVVSTTADDEEMGDELPRVCERIDADRAFAGLRPLMRKHLFRDEGEYLDAIAGDLLKGGPDPGVAIPVAAAVDAFAARHHLVAVRAGASSIAQKAETHLGRRVFALALPMLTRASSARLLTVRDALKPELGALRDAIVRSHHAAQADPALADAARAYADAFRARSEAFLPGDDETGARVQAGYLSVTALMMPADAVLKSSLVAVRALARRGVPVGAPQPATPEARPEVGPDLFTLIIRPMNIAPAD